MAETIRGMASCQPSTRGGAVGILVSGEVARGDGDTLEGGFIFALGPFIAGGAGDVAEAARRNHFLRGRFEFAEIDEFDGFDFAGRAIGGRGLRRRRFRGRGGFRGVS